METIVNGYRIMRVEDCRLWAAIKIGALRGEAFRSKKAAILFAQQA